MIVDEYQENQINFIVPALVNSDHTLLFLVARNNCGGFSFL
jgi:hypothetical protein